MEFPEERDSWNDLKYTILLMFDGGKQQFFQTTNLAYLGVAAPATIYSFEHDKRITSLMKTKESKWYHDIASDSSIAMNFPIFPLAFYIAGRSSGNKKMVRYATETTAALYLALVETGIVSFADVHERPGPKEKLSFWETAFRGGSSCPSGHIVPYSVIFFKTLQFYGPYWATIPAVLTYFTGYQRVQDQKHYLSDVVVGFFFAAFASEGVRAAAGHSDNHSFYKWMYEKNIQAAPIVSSGKFSGLRVSLNF